MKKILIILGMIVSIGLLVACTPDSSEKVDITINLTSGPLALEIGETYQLDITTNDEAGYVIEVSNDTVISVSETGLVTALAVGSSTVSVTSISDDTVSKLVTINVTKVNNLSIVEPTSYLWTDQTLQLTYEADGDVAFESSDVNVATIDADGLITAIAPGAFTVTMKLSSDDSIFTTIDLVVYDVATTIMLDGDTKANMGTPVTLTATVGPDNSAPAILWSSSDESVATIDALGVVTPLSAGIVTIMATSMTDESIQATHELVIVNEIIVDGTKSEGDSVDIDSLSFTFGEKLFNNLEDAFDVAVDGVTIRLYDIDVTSAHVLSLNNLSLIGMNENVTVSENLTIDGNDVLIENLSFINQGAIEVLPLTQNVSIMSNTFNQLNNSIDSAIMIHEANGLLIESNIFTNLDNHAILINAIIDGLLAINKNTIDQVGVAVKIMGEDYSSDTSIQIVRNQLSNIEGGFEVLLDSTEILAYARFNSVTDYSAFPAKTNAQSNVDFTLNYWGSETLDLEQFENISERMLMGHYTSENAIIKEADYDPTAPLYLYITSDLELLWVNNEVQLEFEYLPYELTGARFRYRTNAADTLMVSPTGVLQPLQSGNATITIDASHRASDASDTIELAVTTDPGIDLEPSIDTHSLLSGDSVTLEATPYPITIKDSTVTFESSNTAVATVNNLGEVTSLTAGDVIITAKLADDIAVMQTFYLTFYDELDENNLMDLLTLNQQNFLKKHDFFETGTGPSYRVVGYESVSNFYFDEVVVDTSKMIPDAYKGGLVRPGYALSDIPAPYTTYNDLNIHWITVHDTANTDPSASALSHANYLLNRAALNGPQVSWHYTIDDYDMYQHIPEGEVAWHAGDGSNLVGQGSYLGGGNRNAIAIEMNVGMGDDLYRIWQRTAKFSAKTLVKYNLPREHIKFHQHFSGKHCPNALLVSGLEPKFQKMADVEFKVASQFAGAQISMVSSNPEIIDNAGRVIQMPTYTTTVSYTITVILDGVTTARTFNVYVPGTTR